MLGIFFSNPSSGPEDLLISLSEMGIPLLAGFVVGTVSRGKTSFFMDMKSPSGVEKFVKARLLQSWLVTVPIAIVVVAVSTILVPQISLNSLVILQYGDH